jgi:Uma2 family endonuclease
MSVTFFDEAARGNLPPLVPITVEQYHQMIRAGIVHEGAPIELIDGLLVRKDRSARGESIMSHGPRHALLVKRIAKLLTPWCAEIGHHVQVQLPVVLNDINCPEPDVALIHGSEEDYADRHPGPAEITLAIEVADSSVSTDRSTKQRLYAQAGVRRYWLVNIPDSQVEVFEQPDSAGGRYQKHSVRSLADLLTLSVPPADELQISVAELLR